MCAVHIRTHMSRSGKGTKRGVPEIWGKYATANENAAHLAQRKRNTESITHNVTSVIVIQRASELHTVRAPLFSDPPPRWCAFAINPLDSPPRPPATHEPAEQNEHILVVAHKITAHTHHQYTTRRTYASFNLVPYALH